MVTYRVRRTNPRSRWPFRVVRVRVERRRESTHKLSRKFETRELAEAWLKSRTASGMIELNRLA